MQEISLVKICFELSQFYLHYLNFRLLIRLHLFRTPPHIAIRLRNIALTQLNIVIWIHTCSRVNSGVKFHVLDNVIEVINSLDSSDHLFVIIDPSALLPLDIHRYNEENEIRKELLPQLRLISCVNQANQTLLLRYEQFRNHFLEFLYERFGVHVWQLEELESDIGQNDYGTVDDDNSPHSCHFFVLPEGHLRLDQQVSHYQEAPVYHVFLLVAQDDDVED